MRCLCIATAIVLMLATTAFGVNAGPVWNNYAANYGFELYPQAPGMSFADCYRGNNLQADFAAMLSNLNRTLGTQVGGDEDDMMNITLENWPTGSST